jgi:hypothetical protein
MEAIAGSIPKSRHSEIDPIADAPSQCTCFALDPFVNNLLTDNRQLHIDDSSGTH